MTARYYAAKNSGTQFKRDAIPTLVLFIAAVLLAMSTVPTGATEPPGITLGVSPPRLELQLDDGSTSSAVRVINFGQDPAEIEVAVHNWALDANSKLLLTQPTEQSLDQWMVISPLRFTLPPQESQTVRLSIRPKVLPAPGEHRAMVFFKQRQPRQDPRTGLTVVGRVGVAVYGYVGAVERRGELHGVQLEAQRQQPAVARFDISSSGSAHVRMAGGFAVWRREHYPGSAETEPLDPHATTLPAGVMLSGALPSTPVLPATRRSLRLQLPQLLPPGEYILDLNGDLGPSSVNIGIPFHVAHPDVARQTVD